MNVNKKMSSEDFFSEVIDIYQNAREQKYAHLNINCCHAAISVFYHKG